MERFVAEQRRLLELERTAEVEESRALLSSVSVKELCERGLALKYPGKSRTS